jgi:hypothetical protein
MEIICVSLYFKTNLLLHTLHTRNYTILICIVGDFLVNVYIYAIFITMVGDCKFYLSLLKS